MTDQPEAPESVESPAPPAAGERQNRRAEDLSAWGRFKKTMDRFGRDFWMFAITTGIILTLLAQGQQNRNGNNQAYTGCLRSLKAVPIITKLLRKNRDLSTGIEGVVERLKRQKPGDPIISILEQINAGTPAITQDEIDFYQQGKPTKCVK